MIEQNKIESFDAVLESIRRNKKRQFHLLLGNGFSVSYDPDIFSYNALYDFTVQKGDPLLASLFEVAGSTNFEYVMQQLKSFTALAKLFSAPMDLQGKADAAADELKRNLVDAIESLHPPHVYAVPEEKSKACLGFIQAFRDTGGHVFTSNYDLLLYWMLMRNEVTDHSDGFGRDREDEGEFVPASEREYSELRWGRNADSQNVHYIHGALHFFDTGPEVVKEECDESSYLLDKVRRRVASDEYPVFVTGGSSQDKLKSIRHNRYLDFCYEELAAIDGSLVTLGFGFGEYDEHIIDAINRAARPAQMRNPKLRSVYIGTFSDEDREHVFSIIHRFKCKVRVFDSSTVDVWTPNLED